ncbi:MAG: AraC family transcriptional regulator [Zetaproteobacteria bacterium]|nr:MAG: AraC family transcriptional regulator [Zetaproteobacteria bacterium]
MALLGFKATLLRLDCAMDLAESALPSAGPAPKPRRWVLVVDDDPAVLEALATALAPQYHVVTARTGAEALEVLSQRLLDLVLLDNVLPDLPGLAILEIVKRYLPSLPVVLITGYGSEEISVKAFRGGARDYMKKPIQVGELLARIEEILHARRRTGEARAPDGSSALEAFGADVDASGDSSLGRALTFIEANLHTHLSLERVAREAGMSKFHFCRHFKALVGMSFREFLARRRIERASVLLRDRKRSVTEVYLEVGFKDLSHFGRVFRKVTGQPPSRFRLLGRDASSQT